MGVLTSTAVALAQQAPQPPSEADRDEAVGCMRTINTAEVYYEKTYKKGYSPTLEALGEPATGEAVSASRAGLIDLSLSGGKRNGYVFQYRAGKPDAAGNIKTYTATARPMKWQKGVWSIFTDQTGKIRWTDEDRAPTSKDPLIQ